MERKCLLLPTVENTNKKLTACVIKFGIFFSVSIAFTYISFSIFYRIWNV